MNQHWITNHVYPNLKDDNRIIPNSHWYPIQPQVHFSSPFCCLVIPKSVFWISSSERPLTDLLPPALLSIIPACFLLCTSVYILFFFSRIMYLQSSFFHKSGLSYMLACPMDDCKASIMHVSSVIT